MDAHEGRAILEEERIHGLETIAAVRSRDELDAAKVSILGRKTRFSEVQRALGSFDHEERKAIGMLANDGFAVVGQAGSIGRTHVDQRRARLLHHVGDTEAAADLHALATTDDDLAIAGYGREHQQHRRRVVVDNDRRLGAAQHRQQPADSVLPRSTSTRLQIELEVRRRRRM